MLRWPTFYVVVSGLAYLTLRYLISFIMSMACYESLEQ